MKKRSTKWINSVLAALAFIVISYWTGRIFTFTSFVFSWTLNFLLMALYTFMASQLEPKLKSDYFTIKPFERGGDIYKYFGVHLYRKLLVWIGWEKVTRKKNPIKRSLSTLKNSEYNSRSSEFGHAIIAIIVLIVTVWVSDSLNDAKWLIITNLLLNVFPIMVQRYNRPRLLRIIAKMEGRVQIAQEQETV